MLIATRQAAETKEELSGKIQDRIRKSFAAKRRMQPESSIHQAERGSRETPPRRRLDKGGGCNPRENGLQ